MTKLRDGNDIDICCVRSRLKLHQILVRGNDLYVLPYIGDVMQGRQRARFTR